MKSTHTSSQTRSISKAFPISFGIVAQITLLFLVGFFATWLHARFRFPLHLPGRHGLEFMLLVIGARYLSGIKLSSSISVTGAIAASLIPGLGFTDPVIPFIYLAMGALIDFSWAKFGKWVVWVPIAALVGGLAYGLIPLFRGVFSLVTGYYYNSLSGGVFYPWFTHFAFGFVGAVAGAGVASGLKKLFTRK